jgi:hypothetical protein
MMTSEAEGQNRNLCVSPGPSPVAASPPSCHAEEDFNEFSTLDLHVGDGDYIVHSWLRWRSGGDVKGSDAFIPVR